MGLLKRARALFRREKLSAELDEELAFHLVMRQEANAQEGMRPEESLLDAKRRFGNATSIKERTREIDILTFCESVFQDVRFAARMLGRYPGFTVVAVLALSAGIGVNSAVFTAYKAVVLQPLDAKDPRELVNIYRSSPQDRYARGFSYPDFEAFRDHNHVFSGLIAASGDRLALTGAEGSPTAGSARGGGLAQIFGFHFPSLMTGGAKFVDAAIVSENYFSVLGRGAIRGRIFRPQHARELTLHPAVLVSENYWRRRFNRNPEILGKTFRLNGAAFTVTGITPQDFAGTNQNVPDFWVPLSLNRLVHPGSDILHDREDACCALYGRLTRGVKLSAAQADINILSDHLRSLHLPGSPGSRSVAIHLFPGSLFAVAQDSDAPMLLTGFRLILFAVGLVLLIACANVASLQLARSTARQSEISVRLSLGPGRFRLIRQLLTESALIGLMAGAVSLFATWAVLRILMVEIAAALPMEWGALALHVEPDIHVFAYVFSISLVAGILFGLAPAFEMSALKGEGGRVGFSLGNTRLRDVLIAIQVCVCFFLLIAASLLIRGSARFLALDPGYEAKRVIMLDIHFPGGFGYALQKRQSEMQQLHARLSQTQEIESVSAGRPPMGGGLRIAAVSLNGVKATPNNSSRTLFYSAVQGNYFATLGIPLALGRTFTGSPFSPSADEVVLSESAARQLWLGQDPLGRNIQLDAAARFHEKGESIPQLHSYRVVGIAKDIRAGLLGGADASMVYLPMQFDARDEQSLLARINGDSQTSMNEIGRQVHAVDPNLVVYAATLEDLLTGAPSFLVSRLSAIFASIVGMLGLSLACTGIYGMVSYAVVRRTREVGIRMALGARRKDVLLLILRESTRPVLFGLLAGLLAAAAIAPVLRSLLFGLGVLDPISFGGVSALFLLIAFVAALLPARRAMRVDPMVALRWE